jgi:hypothetical protein
LQPTANQTWAAFKIHFARQDRDRIDTTTASSAGYSGAALAVVPVVVPSAPGTAPSAPTDLLGAALAGTALPSGPELVALLTELAKFRAAAATRPTPTRAATTPGAQRGYCWTHGSTANAEHSSATCRNKAPGHVDTATWRNKHGGNPGNYTPPSRRGTMPPAPAL